MIRVFDLLSVLHASYTVFDTDHSGLVFATGMI